MRRDTSMAQESDNYDRVESWKHWRTIISLSNVFLYKVKKFTNILQDALPHRTRMVLEEGNGEKVNCSLVFILTHS